MARTRQNFSIWSGDNMTLNFPITDKAGVKVTFNTPPGAVWMAMDMSAKDKAEPFPSEVRIAKASADDTITMTEDEDGLWTASVNLVGADTEGLPTNEYFHALRIIDGSETYTVSTGVMTLEGSIPLEPPEPS